MELGRTWRPLPSRFVAGIAIVAVLQAAIAVVVIVVTKTKLHPGGCLLPDGGCALVYSVAGTNLVVVAAALTFLHATPARLSPEETQLQLLPALGQPWTKRAVGLFAALFIALVAAWLCAACTADGNVPASVAVAVLSGLAMVLNAMLAGGTISYACPGCCKGGEGHPGMY
ncbi:adenylate cyclase [Micractinium conductrix]|uniref:Adenylate cyclase n=1 Tax=Micractinium conductrix TaxID=554055 RepID=A0A2P6V626_9CHLO|nr:adenylate cyclase [Micractinium conductrix]|eukprot:PSC69543.1 adenylate cyclase [Micractinium conductrix]